MERGLHISSIADLGPTFSHQGIAGTTNPNPSPGLSSSGSVGEQTEEGRDVDFQSSAWVSALQSLDLSRFDGEDLMTGFRNIDTSNSRGMLH